MYRETPTLFRLFQGCICQRSNAYGCSLPLKTYTVSKWLVALSQRQPYTTDSLVWSKLKTVMTVLLHQEKGSLIGWVLKVVVTQVGAVACSGENLKIIELCQYSVQWALPQPAIARPAEDPHISLHFNYQNTMKTKWRKLYGCKHQIIANPPTPPQKKKKPQKTQPKTKTSWNF